MKAPPVSADVLSTDVGSTTNPRVVVGIPPSDPPPAGSPEATTPSVQAKGVVDGVVPSLPVPTGVDPLDALETLETPSAPPAATKTDSEEAAANAAQQPEREEQEESTRAASLGSTIAFGSASDGEPAPSSAGEPLASKTVEAADEKTKDFGSTLVLGSTAEPKVEKVEEVEPANTKRSFASTMAFGSASASEPEPAEKAETIAAAAEPVVPVKVAEAPLPTPRPVVESDDARFDHVDRVEAADAARGPSAEQAAPSGKKNKKNKKAARERERAEAEAAAERTDPDEISVPPIGDIGVDEKFFSEGDVSRHLAGEAIEGDDALTIPDKAKRKSEPHVVERRARFVRYVKWAVAGAAVVCLAAVARTTLTSKAPASEVRAAAVVVAPTAPEAPPPAAPKAAVQAAAPIATPAAPATEGPVAVAEPTAANVAAPATTEPTAAPAEAKTEPATETTPEEVVTGDAKEEKAKARTSLEKRKLADAIEAGERSVKLDPTDGEAWLILGAAYQEKGNMIEARRAYAACVKEGKTGPRQECAKMLR